ncbi:MAG: tRNA (guanosine(46)-N7)-methyltransferase TrmB [Lachnospiraceae bacterium]|nr:tRNA (guanosine(46)-N7)-methyltransferase TrmB [Lachnospiraceae bacterium]
MRLKHIKGAEDAVYNSIHCINLESIEKKALKNCFSNPEKPLHIEIGTGKGQFIMELAHRNPDINYLGIERYSSVLLRACQKMDEMETPLPNLKFICNDAEVLPDYLNEGDVERIYLNFSDPWPKDRHAKRRLTSSRFLARYDRFLMHGGEIRFKTDNNDLFEFSVEEFKSNNWELTTITRDLHADAQLSDGNIMTEYEERFSKVGVKINMLIAKRK